MTGKAQHTGRLSARLTGTIVVSLLLLLVGACNAPTGSPPSATLAAPPVPGTDAQTRWEQTLAAARQEGKVVLVTHTNLYYRQVVQKFQEKYPDIQVEQVAIRPSEFTPKVVTEQQNGVYGYDAWISPTSNMVETVVPAGGFEHLTDYLMLSEVTDS